MITKKLSLNLGRAIYRRKRWENACQDTTINGNRQIRLKLANEAFGGLNDDPPLLQTVALEEPKLLLLEPSVPIFHARSATCNDFIKRATNYGNFFFVYQSFRTFMFD